MSYQSYPSGKDWGSNTIHQQMCSSPIWSFVELQWFKEMLVWMLMVRKILQVGYSDRRVKSLFLKPNIIWETVFVYICQLKSAVCLLFQHQPRVHQDHLHQTTTITSECRRPLGPEDSRRTFWIPRVIGGGASLGLLTPRPEVPPEVQMLLGCL